MDLDIPIQTSVLIIFFSTLTAAVIPPVVRRLWSRRKENNVFTVSDNYTSKTCLRHRKECSSSESLILQVFNFFAGGLLFGFLVLRLLPQSYYQFHYVFNPFNITSNDDNILTDNNNDTKFKKSLPYVELIISGFFFVVYFFEQLLQAFTGWDGWHAKSSFVHLPTISASKPSADKRKTDDLSLQDMSQSNQPSLVACHRKDFEEEITEDNADNKRRKHKPECPLSANQNIDNSNNKQLRIPSRPSHPSSIIIVLPNQTNELSTSCLQLKAGLAVITSVSMHQLTNGVTIALQEGNWCWISVSVILSHSLLTAIMVTSKLMNSCRDNYIMFLCQLIFSSLMPLAIIISSLLKISAFSEMLLIGLSNGATFHLVFMTLLQSERCTRLAGLIQYLAMYSGFTIMLCVTLFIASN